MGSENPMPDEILYCIPHEYVLVQNSRSFGCLCSQQILSSICIKVKVAHGRHLSNIKNKLRYQGLFLILCDNIVSIILDI